MPIVTTPTVALVGNPNTGKTTLFNALSGLRQRTGNYPGVTVETKKGHFHMGEQTFSLIDLPGTYSLAPRSPDEMVAVDIILGNLKEEPRPDVVITIVDASNLERNLYLVTQVLELGVPIIVALNMVDVAKNQGITIDTEKLSDQLGVPVVPIQANRSIGLDKLKETINQAINNPAPEKHPKFPDAFEREITALKDHFAGQEVPPFLLRRLLLDIGGTTESRLAKKNGHDLARKVNDARTRLAEAGCPVPAVEARTRYGWIREVTSGCITRPEQRKITLTDRLDHILTHRIWGTLIFLGIMFLMFQSIFTWAGPLMDQIDRLQDFLKELVLAWMAPGPLRSLITDGIIAGVGGVLIFLPQIMFLFGFIAVFEDCGYMARAAFLMDKLMARCGLSGKSFIPMLSSVACAIPGIMGARVIENPRDRLTTILVAPLMSCSARLPVYFLFAAAFLGPVAGYPWWLPGLVIFCMYLVGIIVAPLVALALKRTILKGETPAFVMEMPLYKVPSLRIVFQRMADAGWMFIRRAGTIILASMIVVWALLYFPNGGSYETQILAKEALIEDELEELEQISNLDEEEQRTQKVKDRVAKLEAKVEPVQAEINNLHREWSSQSILGQMGQAVEPVVKPLGWDWKIGMGAIASFPAREVFVATMGIIYSKGEVDAGDEEARSDLGETFKQQEWEDKSKIFNIPVALSIMVFFALCCQCASTLAVIKRETNSWFWPVFTFVYMTVLAYVGAFVVYQIGMLFY